MFEVINDKIALLGTNKIPTFSEFLHSSMVQPEGYGGKILKRIYRDIFIRSTDFKRDYEKYYSVEYASFELFMKHYLDFKFDARILDYGHVLLIKPDLEFIKADLVENCLEMFLKQFGDQIHEN